MKNRVALWGSAGFAVSLSWFIYAVTRPVPLTLGNHFLWTLVKVTQPVIATGLPMKFYWVFLCNALTYALIGLMFESVRLRLHHSR